MRDSTESLVGNIAVLSVWVAYLAGIAYVILFFVKGREWSEDTVYPWIVGPITLAMLALIPVSFVLSIIRRTRPLGGLGLYIASYMLAFTTWLWCLGLARELVGIVGMIIGLLLLGIGIIGAAFIGALIHAEWALASVIAAMFAAIFVLRIIGTKLVESAPAPESDWLPPPPEFYDLDEIEDDED
jgi:hypothetical protein